MKTACVLLCLLSVLAVSDGLLLQSAPLLGGAAVAIGAVAMRARKVAQERNAFFSMNWNSAPADGDDDEGCCNESSFAHTPCALILVNNPWNPQLGPCDAFTTLSALTCSLMQIPLCFELQLFWVKKLSPAARHGMRAKSRMRTRASGARKSRQTKWAIPLAPMILFYARRHP